MKINKTRIDGKVEKEGWVLKTDRVVIGGDLTLYIL